MDNTKEYIVCSAIWYIDAMKEHVHQPKNVAHGYVLCGLRHHNIIALNYDLTGTKTTGMESVQGFLTSANRFVNRKEAHEIAELQDQIVHKSGNLHDGVLYSEDIY